MVMRDWSTLESSRVRQGDRSNDTKETWEIFLERRRCSSSERLFMNFFLYLECFFTAGESPVTVILKRSNLNVHEEGVITWGASVRGVGVEHFIFTPVRQKLRTHFSVSRCAKKTPPKSDRHKSQITKFAFVIHKHK